MGFTDSEIKLPEGFCDGCCYNNNPKPELRCKKIKCCYLVSEVCIIDTYSYKE